MNIHTTMPTNLSRQIDGRDIVGATRIRNESRWITRVIDSFLPICKRIFILDDHSTDGTPELIENHYRELLNDRIILIRSTFVGLDESRDKQFLYHSVMSHPDYSGGWAHPEKWPAWICHPDGDEVLDQRDIPLLLSHFENPVTQALRARILYLWNDEQHVRVDGVYRTFNRPTFWRVFNPDFHFQSTPWGKDPDTGQTINFHCSSIPQELLYLAQPSEVRILHLGYMHKEDRLRKFAWYSKMDPNNEAEGRYLHCIQGDVPEVPASAKLKWAGPLEIVPL